MKNKEVLSGVIGGAFFALPYLALGFGIVPSVIIGGAAFAAGELVLSKKEEIGEMNIPSRDLKKTIEKAKSQNTHIRAMIEEIDDEYIKEKLAEIHKSVSQIINTIEKNPRKVKNINNFFDYYLPITTKIIDRYDEIKDKGLSGADSKKFIKDTNEMVEEINLAFKKILNKLYESDIIDTDAEMKVFNSMLKMDGYDSKEIEVPKEDNNG